MAPSKTRAPWSYVRGLVSCAVWLLLAGVTDAADAKVTCNDNNPCTSDALVSGVCKYTPRATGTSCSDGDPCNGVEACDGKGKCLAKPPAIDDGNPCTVDSCTKTGGIKHTPSAAGTSCSDANACNGLETCDGKGKCLAGKAPVLDDGNPCTSDACSPSTGVTHTFLPKGASCADANACNGAEGCDGAGKCTAGTPPILDDGNPCTVDSCDVALGVRHVPVAVGTACSDGNACNGLETCDAAGTCVAGVAPTLDDGNPCTIDACSPSGGVSHALAAPGTSCADGNPCNGAETCDATGACAAAAPPDLDDKNPCTVDACSPTMGITHAPLSGGTSCSDGNLCNGDEICDGAGTCLAGTPLPVSDSNPCTIDTCDPVLGVQHQAATPTCEGTAASWSLLIAGRPSPRDSAAAAYDTVGKRAILFGGESAGVALADTWTWDGSQWKTSAYLAGPSARAAASMVFDSDRGKMLLFGGASHTPTGELHFGDTWELDLASLRWTRRVVDGPSPRSSAAMGYDPTRRRVVLFGGVGPSGDLDDTWEFDGDAWARRETTTAPTGRAGAAFVFHRARGTLTLAGGARFTTGSWGTPLDDVWDWNGAGSAWVPRELAAKPSARSGGAMSADSSGALLFGGTSPPSMNLGDVWTVDAFGAWKQGLVGGEAPLARAGHALLFDATRARHVLFGGLTYSDTGLHTIGLDDVWELEASTLAWTPRTPDSAPASLDTGVAFDTQRKVIVARGRDATTWELEPGQPRWTARPPRELGGPLSSSAMLFDPIRKKTLWLTAGTVDAGPATWEWDGLAWTRRTCTGAPVGLYASATTWDPVRARVLVAFGKKLDGAEIGTTWEIDPTSCTWSERSSGTPRAGAHLAWDSSRNVGVSFGGQLGPTALSDTWQWNGTSWEAKATASAPPGRLGGAITFDPQRGRVVLFGGLAFGSGPSTLLDDVWEFDGVDWAKIDVHGPAPRRNASATWDPERKRVVILGGLGAGDAQLADLWEWDGATFTRRLTGVAPSARNGMSGGSTSSLAVMFGGVRGDGARTLLNDTWIFRDGEWLRASTGAPPSTWDYDAPRSPAPRAGHAFAVGFKSAGTLSGTGLLFGGEGEAGVLGDTWLWDDKSYRWSEWLPVVITRVSPSARTEHALGLWIDNGYVLFGGVDETNTLRADTWTWSPSNGWVERKGGEAPAPRASHAMAADPIRKKLILFGGRGPSGALRDTWEWDPTTLAWSRRAPTISPPALFGHRMVWDPSRGRLVLTGGSGDDANKTSGETWDWDGATWSKREPLVALEPRVGHFAGFDPARGEVFVFGGFSYRHDGTATMTYGDVWSFTRAGASDVGTARYANGTPCAADAACLSGNCVDGVCCNTKCEGQCAACDAPGSIGSCVAIAGAPHGARTNCVTDACGPHCDGKDTTSCHALGSGSVCAAQVCTAGVLTSASTCSSSGTCAGASTTSCAPYGCKGNACATGCYSDGDCFPSHFCVPNYSAPGTCRAPARLTSFTAPSTAKVATAITATATATLPDATPQYLFTWSAADGVFNYPCGWYALSSSCTWSFDTPGTYTIRVAARSPYSSRDDDAREITLTVTP